MGGGRDYVGFERAVGDAEGLCGGVERNRGWEVETKVEETEKGVDVGGDDSWEMGEEEVEEGEEREEEGG